ncbi:hypothetical protein [Ramlibacter sp.]|uniref:hypothetical protein n=1 Tax=Ramlibacter sp. TaxID=1917967 RepID=UPI002CF904F2|nr:hypothetical protein [Ramlibacter sp.]HWI81399.1 hypothetical protein [Ramlibacter sp.]
MATQHSFPTGLVSRPLIGAIGAALAAACLLAAAPAEAGTRAFNEAVQQYRAGHLADAFGRFFALANDGDADAARIALFMHQFGPTLYGRYWDANPREVAYWQSLQAKPTVHAAPPFQPDWLDAGTAQQRVVKRGVRKTATQ